MAALIVAALNACQDCRARYFTPMSLEELETLLKRFTPETVFREVRARGVTGLGMSGATANVLRASGAQEDLIAYLVPDDRIPTIPLVAPYKPVALKRAQEYDPAAKEGWLKINMVLPPGSQSEFIFKHTGLFIKTTGGAEPADIQAYFSKPAPRNKTAEFIDIECGLDAPELACGPESLDEKRGAWVRTVLPKKGKKRSSWPSTPMSRPTPMDARGFRSPWIILIRTRRSIPWTCAGGCSMRPNLRRLPWAKRAAKAANADRRLFRRRSHLFAVRAGEFHQRILHGIPQGRETFQIDHFLESVRTGQLGGFDDHLVRRPHGEDRRGNRSKGNSPNSGCVVTLSL